MRVILGVFMGSSQRALLRSVRFRRLSSIWRHQNFHTSNVSSAPKFIGQTKDDLGHLLFVGFKKARTVVGRTHGYPYSQTFGERLAQAPVGSSGEPWR